MKIAFDIDGVLANYSEAFRKRFEEYYQVKLPEDIFENGYQKLWCYPEPYYDLVNYLFNYQLSDTFWFRLKSLLDEEEDWEFKGFLMSYNVKCDIYFLSTRKIDVNISKDWVSKTFGIYDPNVIHATNKDDLCKLLKIDFMLEDNWETASDIERYSNTRCYLINRPYNTNFEHPNRVNSILEFLKIAKENVNENIP